VAELSVYAATPSLFVNGREERALSSALLELAVEETQEGLYRCEATFINWGFKDGAPGYLMFDRDVLDFGTNLRIDVRGGQATIFDGRISALEGRYGRQRDPEFLVLAEDRLQDLRMTRRTRSFEDSTDADLVRSIASEHGLQAEVDFDGPTYAAIAQVNQSDLAFLRERVRLSDAELWVEGDRLKAVARARRNQGEVKLTYQRDLLECALLADVARQYTTFQVTGWDFDGKQPVEFAASAGAISGELRSDTGGGAELERTFAARTQQIVHRLPLTRAAAQAAAEAEFRRMARRFVTGTCTAEGDGRIRTGATVELTGLGTIFDGRYYVTSVRHEFTLNLGYRTMFAVERAGISAA
jgi:hypothetical protein